MQYTQFLISLYERIYFVYKHVTQNDGGVSGVTFRDW